MYANSVGPLHVMPTASVHRMYANSVGSSDVMGRVNNLTLVADFMGGPGMGTPLFADRLCKLIMMSIMMYELIYIKLIVKNM